jgi:hypothetical protein
MNHDKVIDITRLGSGGLLSRWLLSLALLSRLAGAMITSLEEVLDNGLSALRSLSVRFRKLFGFGQLRKLGAEKLLISLSKQLSGSFSWRRTCQS